MLVLFSALEQRVASLLPLHNYYSVLIRLNTYNTKIQIQGAAEETHVFRMASTLKNMRFLCRTV
jgi:hypothetical protein